MKILEINSCNFGSTGNIMLGIAEVARKNYLCYTACPEGRSMREKKLKNHFYIGSRAGRMTHCILGKFTGFQGTFSVIDTFLFLKKIDKLHVDVIHLHNLHNCYINLPMLFRYIKKKHIRTVWTLHDCWALTGQCPHFTLARCDKWKNGCYDCPQYKNYPATSIDQSRRMWKLKKRWFTGIEDITIVTPSYWLADLVKQSYLKEYTVQVIHNGINLSVFKPIESDFRKRYRLENKYIILGVAFSWGVRKGLDVFIELSKRLDERFQIVLIGTNKNIDQVLPSQILSIHCTQNQQELAEIYTAADVFVNPTREEVLGLVNIEALACGTPVVTFKTGGSPECVDEKSGKVVNCNDVEALEEEIISICEKKIYVQKNCVERAKCFDRNKKFREYVDLYRRI